MRLRTPSPPPDLAVPRAAREPVTTDLRRRRRRGTWQSRLRRGAIVVALAGLLALATWVVGYSDLLAVDDVEADGARGSLLDTIVETAAIPYGQPLARVDTAGIAARVADVPDVASVTVTRGWPSAVRIDVTLREPVASLAGPDGWYRVDTDGVLFAPAPAPAPRLPVLEAPDDADSLSARKAGVSVADALPRRVLRRVERIEATTALEVRLVLRDGRAVLWGSADEAALKADVLTALLDTPATQYDVSVPQRPTLRPVDTG